MTKWNELSERQVSYLSTEIAIKCMSAAGMTDSSKQGAIVTIASNAIGSLADVRCVYDLGGLVTDDEFLEGVAGILYIGNPIIPQIVAIIRNSGTGANIVPNYGRTTGSSTVNKSGTEQVALKPTVPGTLDERIEVAVPDVRAASTGNVTATDVDSADKFRFDSEAEKSLAVLFSRWIRRASFTPDL